MALFQVGEVVVCSVEVRDAAGALADPATSMKIEITNPAGTVTVTETAMTKDSTGKYHYDFASAAQPVGVYTAKYIATDGTRVSITRSRFALEP